MRRADFWLLAPVVIAAAIMFVWHDANLQRADHFFFQVMGLALAMWIAIWTVRAIRSR